MEKEIIIEVIGWTGTITASLLSLPDFIKCFKNLKEYSEKYKVVGPQGLLIVNSVIWTSFGILIERLQVWIPNLICFICSIIILIAVISSRIKK